MKKYFLTLALLFGMLASYAGNHATAFQSKAENSISQETSQQLLSSQALNLRLLAAQSTSVLAATKESCTLRFQGTVDGKEIDLTVTFKDISCEQLIKMLLAAL